MRTKTLFEIKEDLERLSGFSKADESLVLVNAITLENENLKEMIDGLSTLCDLMWEKIIALESKTVTP